MHISDGKILSVMLQWKNTGNAVAFSFLWCFKVVFNFFQFLQFLCDMFMASRSGLGTKK